MNSLNSNLANKSNSNSNSNNITNNSNNSNRNNNSNSFFSELSNMSLIILIAAGIILLVFVIIILSIYYKTYSQNQIRDHVEQEIVPYIHDCKNNPKIVYGTKIPSSTLGNEYSLTFWVYINGLDYRKEFNKHIITKGKQDNFSGNEEYLNANPSIYLKRKENTMVFTFELDGGIEQSLDLGCYDKLQLLTNAMKKGELIKVNLELDLPLVISKLVYSKIDYFLEKQDKNNNFKLIKVGAAGKTYINYLTSSKKYNKTTLINSNTDLFERTTGTTTGTTTDSKIEIKRDETSKYKIVETSSQQPGEPIHLEVIYAGGGSQGYINKEDVPTINIKSGTALSKTTYVSTEGTVTAAHETSINNILTGVGTDKYTIASDKNLTINIPVLFNITLAKQEDDFKIGEIDVNIVDPESSNIGKTPKEITIEDCRKKLKEDKSKTYKYFGMFGNVNITGQNHNKNYCISSTESLESKFDMFTYLKTKKTDYDELKKDGQKCNTVNGKLDKLGGENNMFIHSIEAGISLERVEIKNIPLQRWVCMTLQVHNNIIDIFMDGLLYQTKIIQKGSPKANTDNIIIGNHGGFDGYVSKTVWANKALHPGEIFEKYKQGPRISLTTMDRIKNFLGMGAKQPEGKKNEENENKY